jgi:hypothetical protein
MKRFRVVTVGHAEDTVQALAHGLMRCAMFVIYALASLHVVVNATMTPSGGVRPASCLVLLLTCLFPSFISVFFPVRPHNARAAGMS